MLSDADIQRIADRIIEALGGNAGLISSRDEYVDYHGAAQVLGCSVATIERRVREGSIPSVKFGRLRRIRRTDLLNLNKKGGADA